MRIEPDISTVSVVLLGSFNPAIFIPAGSAWRDSFPERPWRVPSLVWRTPTSPSSMPNG